MFIKKKFVCTNYQYQLYSIEIHNLLLQYENLFAKDLIFRLNYLRFFILKQTNKSNEAIEI